MRPWFCGCSEVAGDGAWVKNGLACPTVVGVCMGAATLGCDDWKNGLFSTACGDCTNAFWVKLEVIGGVADGGWYIDCGAGG